MAYQPGLPPDGYWYVVAYEAAPGGSTWGGGNPVSWKRYYYYQERPIYGTDAAGMALNAGIQHRQTSPQRGAVRAYWWDGVQWQLQPSMNQDWGSTRSLTAAPAPPSETLPAPQTQTQTQTQQPATQSTGIGWLWLFPIGVAGAIFYSVVRNNKRF